MNDKSMQPDWNETTPVADEQPLYLRIRDRFVNAITNGAMKPGQRVPSIRVMARELQVSRNTVEAAYGILIGEGYLEAQGQAGTYVTRPHTAPAHVPRQPAHARSDARLRRTSISSGTRSNERHEPPGPLLYTAAQSGAVMPLQVGLPALDLFPRQLWAQLSIRAARRQSHLLAYTDPGGLPELRRAIACHLSLARGLDCTPEQIFVTAGFRGAFNLFLSAMSKPRDTVWIEEPCFPPSRTIIKSHGAAPIPIPVDEDGMRVEDGIARAPCARFALVTPAHQSPLGVTLSPRRRQELLDWARTNDAHILEDDYDSEFRYDRRRIPALSSQDAHGVSFLAGTFSKTLSPALGLGYLVVPPPFIDRFRQAAATRNEAGAGLVQSALHEMIEQHRFSRHIHEMRLAYARRRTMLANAIQDAFADRLRITTPTSGLNLIAWLTRDENDVELEARARVGGFGISSLSPRYQEAGHHKALLLGFANITSQKSADKLARALKACLEAGNRPDCAHINGPGRDPL